MVEMNSLISGCKFVVFGVCVKIWVGFVDILLVE